ncbi:LPS export ABC transporter protein LptC [Chitinophaga ginsengisegetis]|uniref:LPS export ABC transporter protein LptC n=1 Tax=Chitinophaga ginsengisegetis TaxID=393003 RepID=A0A1T5P768_9BACT|nr:LPS export ABC transporter periplasmic protein LptC [Chitinophaga ginsengisegetis]MDR6565952.1 LPS export ABC transporter protein LptC [Chitinophaga ginsengisegetis]MDR6645681.1 LPS export ABC transporter protein LptC [Chitinophaga ginsengisegetis]MDR6651727.1 LPS export ABC transporter protein LptC [Chitinophaga ginsengisegetis]SKD08614.1 LPS export ABC transporter protein LptC [Chitinophaga ginsengisegetis]
MIKRAILFFIIAIAVSSCENDIDAVMELDSKKAATENGQDIVIIFSQGGKVNAKLMGPTMERGLDKPTYVAFNNGLKVFMYNDSLGLESTLSAKKGKFMEDDGDVFLSDSVIVINKKGERLDTKELNWDPKRKIFYSTKEVFIKTPTDSLHGWGLEANQDFSEKKILKVSGPITVQDSTAALN